MSSIGGVSSTPQAYEASKAPSTASPASSHLSPSASSANDTSSTVKLADGATKTVVRNKEGEIVSATVDPNLLKLANGAMETTLISRDGQTTTFTTGDGSATGAIVNVTA